MKTRFPDLVPIGRLASYKLQAYWAIALGDLPPSRRRKLKAIRAGDGLKLHIASGPVPRNGWLNIDVASNADISRDLRRPFPLPGGCAKYIFSEHFVDHVQYPDVITRVLAECQRPLESGGVARFVLHDAKAMCLAYATDDANYFRRGEHDNMLPIEAVKQLFRFNDFHQFLYDFPLFHDLLLKAGFSKVDRRMFKTGPHPELLLDYDFESRDALSMYIEAIR